jgi:receptor protein-tyrosine kinase
MDLIERAEQKKKKEGEKGGSLVERAAAKTGTAKGVGIGIGDPSARREARPDPSSLNPSAPAEQNDARFRGIGQPGAPRKEPQAEPAPQKKPEAKETAFEKAMAKGIGQPKQGGGLAPAVEARQPAADAPERAADSGIGKTGKDASRRKPEEIDLVALREAGYITPDMPPNLMSEEFRIIKRTILLNAFSKGDKQIPNGNVILVTSSNPGEGKTFCAIKLAL